MTTITLPVPPSANNLFRNVRKGATDEQIAEAYSRLGSVWKVGDELGMSGQVVSDRMRKAGIPTKKRWLTDEDREIIRNYYETVPAEHFYLDQLATDLGRTRAVISREANRMGLSNPRRRQSEKHREANRTSRIKVWQEKPHPRGMAGKKHTPETLAKVSEASKRSWATWKTFGIGMMSPERLQEASNIMSERARKMAAERTHSRAKGGRRDDLGDTFFRSRWEANYARYLNLLMKLGAVESWEYEPKTFWFEKILRGVRSYKPDFRVFYKGDPVPEYVEIKGWVTAKDRTKWKRMKKYHPGIKLIVVGEKEYNALARKWKSAIPNWESGREPITPAVSADMRIAAE